LHYRCKQCDREIHKTLFLKDPEKFRARAAQYRKDHPNKTKEANKKWRQTHRKEQALYHRAASLRRRYGLTQFGELLSRQRSQCAICHEKMLLPYVDHCHATGKVRGLLCQKCNSAIGFLDDNPWRADAAAEYLRKHV
jgi:NAD-dependent SIR2 family protein deacetylase